MINKRVLQSLTISLLLLFTTVKADNHALLTFAVPEDKLDERSDFPIKLLNAIVAEQNAELSIKALPIEATQYRVIHLLKKGFIDIAWFAANNERIEQFHAIEIPIAKGLLGYRMLLVHEANGLAYTPITKIEQLRSYTFVQGIGWPDNQILSYHELDLLTVSDYHRMFKLVDMGRIDMFPRSIIEVWNELDAHRELSVTVNDSIVLHYPLAQYFFFRKENQHQADIVRQGFEKLIASGAYDVMFTAHFAPILRRSNLAAKQVIELNNPFFEIPEALRAYFYSQDDSDTGHAMASNRATAKDSKLADL